MEQKIFVQKPVYTVNEVAALMKCNDGYINKLIKLKLLPCLRAGKRLVLHDELMEFFKKYQGYDITDPTAVKKLDFGGGSDE